MKRSSLLFVVCELSENFLKIFRGSKYVPLWWWCNKFLQCPQWWLQNCSVLKTRDTFSKNTVPFHCADDVHRQNSQPPILLQDMIEHYSQPNSVVSFLLKESFVHYAAVASIQQVPCTHQKSVLLCWITQLQPHSHWSFYRGRSK